MVVTSVDVRISIMVPKLFSLVPTHKIEAAMKASALGSTKAALRTVCDCWGGVDDLSCCRRINARLAIHPILHAGLQLPSTLQ